MLEACCAEMVEDNGRDYIKTCCLQMEEMMDLVQTGAVQAIDLRQKQEELRETDQNYIQVP